MRGLLNAEGGLHEENIILSQIIAEKYSELSCDEFSEWIKGDGFSTRFAMSWSHGAGIKYLSSVRRCEPTVLGQTASEIYAQHATQDMRGVIGWGKYMKTCLSLKFTSGDAKSKRV